jgi:hypothetical protein
MDDAKTPAARRDLRLDTTLMVPESITAPVPASLMGTRLGQYEILSAIALASVLRPAS